MNAPAPTCSTCGGVNTNPQATQCRFCGQALTPQTYGAAQAYGSPQGYGAQGHGAPQQPYGAGGYGAPQGYGQPPASPYGGPQPNMYGYGGPQPNMYGGPQPNMHPPVAGFGGAQPFQGHGYVNRSAWSSGLSTFFWVRLVIAAIAIGISLLGACASAISH